MNWKEFYDSYYYKYVLNPYNSTDENLKNYPAQLRNYDIIIPLMNMSPLLIFK